MKRHEVKMKNRLGLGKWARNMLGLLRTDIKSSVSSIPQESFAPEIIYHHTQRDIRSALLNAECRKTEAEVWSKRHFIH